MILVDVGNSSIKWCQADQRLGPVFRCGRFPEQLVADLREHKVELSAVWVSSVAGKDFDEALQSALQSSGFGPVQCVESPPSQSGLINSYREPGRMGVDRWLAMLAARDGRAEPVAVIDAGSALTIDLIAGNGRHEGGYILPGVAMMERSLLRDTQRVRFEGAVGATVSPGRSTLDCVNAGTWIAALGAVRQALISHPDHRVVVTGGDGQALMSLGINGEWRPNLVLEGLLIAAGAAG